MSVHQRVSVANFCILMQFVKWNLILPDKAFLLRWIDTSENLFITHIRKPDGGRWTAGIPTNPIKSQLFWCEKTWATGFPDCFHPHPHLPHVSYWLSMVTLELFWLGAVSEWRITGIFLAANVPTFSDKAWLYSLYLPKISQSIPGILVSVQVWTNNPWCQSHPQLVPALLSQQIEKRWVWKWGIPKSSIIHFYPFLGYIGIPHFQTHPHIYE